jgi:hypothetical protein
MSVTILKSMGNKRMLSLGLVAAIIFSLLFANMTQAVVLNENSIVSGAYDGSQSNAHLYSIFEQNSISANGKYVAFGSKASNLVEGDTNSKSDVFTRELSTSDIKRVSVSSSGIEANNESYFEAVSETGRFVAFKSKATNLIDGQTTSIDNNYIHDIKTGETTRVLRSNSTQPSPLYLNHVTAISNDGRFVLMVGHTNNGLVEGTFVSGSGEANLRTYLWDRQQNVWDVLDKPIDGMQSAVKSTYNASMSCDGSFVAFQSSAPNLTSDGMGANTNTSYPFNVFLYDKRNGDKVTNITKNINNYSIKPAISCNGSYVGINSAGTNIVSEVTSAPDGHLYRYDRIEDEFILVDKKTDGTVASSGPGLNGSVRFSDSGNAFFAQRPGLGDVNIGIYSNYGQAYLRIVDSGVTYTLAKKPDGAAADRAGTPYPSSDGQKTVIATTDHGGMVSTDTNGYSDLILIKTEL